jgi:hypothetical protein
VEFAFPTLRTDFMERSVYAANASGSDSKKRLGPSRGLESASWVDVGVGVCVKVGLGVTVWVNVGVGVWVKVGLGVTVWVNVGGGVGVADGVYVNVAVGVGVGVPLAPQISSNSTGRSAITSWVAELLTRI